MSKNTQNKKRAFTLIEIVVVLGLIGIMIAILLTTMNMSKVKEKETSLLSSNFYQAVQNATIYMARRPELVDTDDDGKFNLEEYFSFYTKKLEGEKENDCSVFQGRLGDITKAPNSSDETAEDSGGKEDEDLTSDMLCSRFNGGIIGGFYYKPECDLELNVYEYLDLDIEEDERASRHITKACGLIVYGVEQSISNADNGILGQNIFAIATTNKNIKYK